MDLKDWWESTDQGHALRQLIRDLPDGAEALVLDNGDGSLDITLLAPYWPELLELVSEPGVVTTVVRHRTWGLALKFRWRSRASRTLAVLDPSNPEIPKEEL